MSIISFWRQFGRRYFWSHLLLGMVAAGIGIPSLLSAHAENPQQTDTPSSQNRQSQALIAFDNLFLRQSVQNPASSFTFNYWQQHAVKNVIKQLSFAFTINSPELMVKVKDEPLPVSNVAAVMLDTLYALLTETPSSALSNLPLSGYVLVQNTNSYHTGLWLAQIRGIRAGPYLTA
ncbi:MULTISPECIES: secA translation cis-regulator SecM [Proteus]|uniref:Secretion monitor n=1 Tax=Proteus penneri TaxID=102862 RepID=A0A0G4Q4Y1_9GAMM|nr:MULTISPECIES: secA translation cis-regulator SecM [Proteus]EEG85405.1 secretion monitor precursor protein [Proteus penneri ATCC 35198]MBJ2117201.1 secA regulator SecM [Proteus penneri]MCO8049503.1 secA translation cis-regulator SecM [Proteus penneri]MCX2588677.1 secA translation cis-regulator SecM [Proteus penneri]NBL79091.1 secA regulator SecM [Proteus sp. G2672]